MLSKTAQLHAGRAVRSIAREHSTHDLNAQTVWSIRSDTDYEARRRGYARNTDWTAYVEAAAIAAIENRIQAGAPNAPNAAPLMPLCDSCGGKGMSTTYSMPDGLCWRCDGTGRLRATREGFPSIIRPGHLGADERLPDYAWPGGYPVIYLDRDTSVCCADCATHDLHMAADDPDDGYTRFTSVIENGDLEHDMVCDGCNAIIAHQNYCYECGECVDTEDTPHLCPKTEPYDVWYLPAVPGHDWRQWQTEYPIAGPDKAHTIARGLREAQTAAFVCVQPSRLVFPPVISEEEE